MIDGRASVVRRSNRIGAIERVVSQRVRRTANVVDRHNLIRIRYFGLLAPRCRTDDLATCRTVLAVAPPRPVASSVGSTLTRSWPCPRCGAPMRIAERLTARQLFLQALLADIVYDTS